MAVVRGRHLLVSGMMALHLGYNLWIHWHGTHGYTLIGLVHEQLYIIYIRVGGIDIAVVVSVKPQFFALQ